MSDFVTILTSTYPQDLYIIKGRLESEGIHCFLKDELTVQANNFYSNALGGVKLQVEEQDAGRAIELLKQLGYIKDEPVKKDMLSMIDEKTSSTPLLKDLNVVNRAVVLIIILVIVLTILLYFVFKR